MSMADKIKSNAQPHLQPGEQTHGAFAGQRTVRNRLGEGGYRCVIATDRRFLVFQSGSFSQTTLKRQIAEAPRGIQLGEPEGLWHTVTIGDETMKVNRRYFDQLRAIDAAG
ncbi:hypothetical protein GCM10027572_35840 [Flexivirga lutea]